MQETQVQSLGQEQFPGGGHGNPPQYSCLENPMDRGTWQAAVHGVAQSRTQLSSSSVESGKMVLMSLSAELQWRCRHREQTYGHRQGAGEGEGGMNGVSSVETYTLPDGK